MGRMCRSVRLTFCRCRFARLVVRVITVLLIFLLVTVGREGKFVTKDYAKSHPKTTVVEKVKVGPTKHRK